MKWMQIWIARNNCAAEPPVRFFLHELRPHRIGKNVETHAGKGSLLSLLFAQHMVMRLRLELPFSGWLRS